MQWFIKESDISSYKINIFTKPFGKWKGFKVDMRSDWHFIQKRIRSYYIAKDNELTLQIWEWCCFIRLRQIYKKFKFKRDTGEKKPMRSSDKRKKLKAGIGSSLPLWNKGKKGSTKEGLLINKFKSALFILINLFNTIIVAVIIY